MARATGMAGLPRGRGQMKVSELYAPHGPFVGQAFHVIGSAPSMNLFPLRMLEGRLCVLLNTACTMFPSLGPIAFCNARSQIHGHSEAIKYRVGKGRLRFEPGVARTDNHIAWNDPDWYVFSYREPIIKEEHGGNSEPIHTGDMVSHHDEGTLWAEPCYYWSPRGGSVSAFAIQFALYCGARSITLVGCDACEFGGERYAAGKEGSTMHRKYHQYAYGCERMWRECYQRGVPLTSWTPFFGLGYHQDQYRNMTAWLKTR